MFGVWDEILVVLQQVRAVAQHLQRLDLLPKGHSGFDRPPTTKKAEDLAKDGVNRYSDPAFGVFWR